jgi:hypothetical protein
MYSIGRTVGLAIMLAFLIFGFAWQASGDVTTCYGAGAGNCTVSSPNGIRQMNNDEALAHQRQQQRYRLTGIDCDFASDRLRCKELLAAAEALFR